MSGVLQREVVRYIFFSDNIKYIKVGGERRSFKKDVKIDVETNSENPRHRLWNKRGNLKAKLVIIEENPLKTPFIQNES
jgi:hypothetical protein